jgi:hypothetical protein
MKKVSPYSVTQIGVKRENEENIQKIRQHFKEESKVVLNYLKETHYSRKLAHMQVNYPETVKQLEAHVVAKPHDEFLATPNCRLSINRDQEAARLKSFMNTLKSNILEEHHINERKRVFNRVNSRKASSAEVSSHFINFSLSSILDTKR